MTKRSRSSDSCRDKAPNSPPGTLSSGAHLTESEISKGSTVCTDSGQGCMGSGDLRATNYIMSRTMQLVKRITAGGSVAYRHQGLTDWSLGFSIDANLGCDQPAHIVGIRRCDRTELQFTALTGFEL